MTDSTTSLQNMFSSRLDNLSHFLNIAETHFGDEVESLLQRRLTPDMFPLGTQIVFTCNQPRNFALWCADRPADNLPPEVISVVVARRHIADTQALLANIRAADNKLANMTHVALGQGLSIELTGRSYVDDFLLPNFYFHLTTAYNIIRMAGAPIGKRDFMKHLVPFLKHHPGA